MTTSTENQRLFIVKLAKHLSDEQFAEAIARSGHVGNAWRGTATRTQALNRITKIQASKMIDYLKENAQEPTEEQSLQDTLDECGIIDTVNGLLKAYVHGIKQGMPKIWLAKIVGTDPQWGVKRAFCKKEVGKSSSKKSASLWFTLDGDGIYEWNYESRGRCFFVLESDEITKILTRDEAIDETSRTENA